MTRTRILLNTAGLIAAALAVQGFVLGLWSTVIGLSSFGQTGIQILGPALALSLLVGLLHCAAFGLGVFLALRWFARVDTTTSWRQTILRAVLATLAGAVVAFAFAAIVSLIAAVTIGAYPFGYSLNAAVDGSKIQFGIQNAIAGSLTPLIGWAPLTVLGIVFLKLWLPSHLSKAEAKGRASVSV
jgi:hypothetical protein